ncbi:50S ribosomal protein L6 [Candidatus Gottesmanbacteria bacterium RIFCSPLOWO2_01_FULL_46_9]|uniref:Large ribosomal subunit protein uL6 n=1 Tax=Candidatus Gottesmanbacteria bacterium RIFCSPLOWO2_01_FULL_46_9 TaxID=1798394 RepID=A0A1F6B3F6_9BACT|nr:MAG: 50S ribosomal protein L6 [Candidatus Gottesmanbacteria bacterium RIFCSPLOWO2_01_FULL_46_9]
MSRIGNAIIVIPKEVTVSEVGREILVKGVKGEVRVSLPSGLTMNIEGASLHISRKNNDKPSKSLHGYLRATLANAVHGVTNGWTKTLELSGVGYRASVSGANLVLTIGFSHPVTVTPPAGIAFAIADGKIVVSGVNRQEVGQIAAKVREIKKPEPYKGKGIKYEGEYIRKKAGKAKAVGGAPGAK